MFDSQKLLANAFVDYLVDHYQRAFPEESRRVGVLTQSARTALDLLANCDAAYHDIEHSMLVTDVGQAILWGRLSSQGDVGPEDWLHAVVAMLFHDVGYLRGILTEDRAGDYVCDRSGKRVQPPPGSTDAYMAPYHVTRGRLFVEQRFATDPHLNAEVLSSYIEMTRFPVPDDPYYQRVGDLAGLVRAADLIGQLADPRYLQKLSHLYAEFRETGDAERMGYKHAGHLRSTYPAFFYQKVSPLISEGVRLLRRTNVGRQWVAQLYAHVYTEQHNEPSFGPERVESESAEITVMALPRRTGSR